MAVLSYLFKGHIKTASNGPSYSNAVIGTLAVDGVGRYIWYSEEGTGGAQPAQALPCCTKCNSPPNNSVPTSYYLIWHYNYLHH